MSRANEIYNYERSLKREIENLGSDINSQAIMKYHLHRVAEGMSLGRQYKCINMLKLLSKILGRRFEDATKDDMVRLIAEIEQRRFSVWTKRDYKIILKKFYQWLFTCEEGYPAIEVDKGEQVHKQSEEIGFADS